MLQYQKFVIFILLCFALICLTYVLFERLLDNDSFYFIDAGKEKMHKENYLSLLINPKFIAHNNAFYVKRNIVNKEGNVNENKTKVNYVFFIVLAAMHLVVMCVKFT